MHLGEEDHRGKVPSLSHPIKGRADVNMTSLWILTLIQGVFYPSKGNSRVAIYRVGTVKVEQEFFFLKHRNF